MDRLTKQKRSWLMSRIASKNTKPELILRSLIHRCGYRFRLHNKSLPGKPDIVFSQRRKVIFMHGCFWHGHYCKRGKMPKSRIGFWVNKIKTNRTRDRRVRRQLSKLDWSSLAIWECDLKDPEKLTKKVVRFMEE